MKQWIQKGIQFLKEVYVELKKVTWLGRKEVIASTLVVCLLVVIVSLFIGLLDFILSRLLSALL